MRSHIKYITFLGLLFLQTLAFSQKPREVDLENDPVDWSDPAKIIVLIVIPVLMLITGLIIRQINLKKKDSEGK